MYSDDLTFGFVILKIINILNSGRDPEIAGTEGASPGMATQGETLRSIDPHL